MQNHSASDTYLQKMSVKCAECTKNTRAHLSNARVCLRCFLFVVVRKRIAVSSTALRRIGDSLFRNNKKIGILFDADKVSIRIYCRHAGRAASHTKIKDRIALIRVTPGYDTEFDTKTMPLFLFINVHFDGLALLLLSKT